MLFKKSVVIAALSIGLQFFGLLLVKVDGGLFSKAYSYIVFLSLLTYVVFLFRGDRSFILSSYFPIFYFAFLFVSAIAAELGAYMLEAGRYGALNGSALIISIFFIICLEFGKIAYLYALPIAQSLLYPKFSKAFEFSMAFSALIVTFAVCGFVLYNYSSPMLLGIERGEYLTLVVPEWVRGVKSLAIQVLYLCITVFLMLGHGWLKRVFGVGLLCVLGLLVFVFGEKFSSLNLCIMFLCIALAGIAPQTKFSLKGFSLIALAVAGMLSLVVYNYISLGRDPSFVFTRIVLQAQVIWNVMEAPLNSLFWVGDRSCFLGCEGFATGAQYLDYVVLPKALYEFYQSSGTSLSGYFPAVLIQQFGFVLATLVAIIGSMFLAVVQAFLVVAIGRGALLFSFVIFKLYYSILAFLYFGQLGVFNIMLFACLGVGFVMIVMARLGSGVNLNRCLGD